VTQNDCKVNFANKGFNNKIKVAKRIGYGYRDDDFFFTLIRYLSIPSVRSPSHKKIVMNRFLNAKWQTTV